MWKPRKFRGGPPPVCWRGPPIGPPLPPGRPGFVLHCMARWKDHDPDAYVHLAATFQLQHIPPGNFYEGVSAPTGDHLELWIGQVAATDYWRVRLKIWDEWRTPETYEWPPVYVDPDENFQTPFLSSATETTEDFAIAQVAI